MVIWDALTGEIVSRLFNHRQCVRDVSWHPFENKIVSTSWDGTLCLWDYARDEEEEDEEAEREEEMDADETAGGGGKQRGKDGRKLTVDPKGVSRIAFGS